MKENEWYVSYERENCSSGFREWWDVCNDGTVRRFHCDEEHAAGWLKDALNLLNMVVNDEDEGDEAAKSPVVELGEDILDLIYDVQNKMSFAEVVGVIELCKETVFELFRSKTGEKQDDGRSR